MHEITKLIQKVAPSVSIYQAFADFVEYNANNFKYAVESHYQNSEKLSQYRQRSIDLMGKYSEKEMDVFNEAFQALLNALERQTVDVLGEVFMELELGSDRGGQFFTPHPICTMMAAMTYDPATTRTLIEESGFITLAEPACGSGSMVLAFADVMRKDGLNFQQKLHVTATDIDFLASNMAYLQLSLMGIPALVVHGDTLHNQRFGAWVTPLHVLGRWDAKLTAHSEKSKNRNPDTPPANQIFIPKIDLMSLNQSSLF